VGVFVLQQTCRILRGRIDSSDNHYQKKLLVVPYRTLPSVALNHGRRIVSELFSGERHKAVEEMWWMRVSDRSFSKTLRRRHLSLTS